VVEIKQIELVTENNEGIEVLDLQFNNPIQSFNLTQHILSTKRYNINLISFSNGNSNVAIE
jgi:hypothetical protein